MNSRYLVLLRVAAACLGKPASTVIAAIVRTKPLATD